MKKLVIAALVASTGLAALGGCVTARATGRALATDVTPLNRLQVVLVPASWRATSGNAPLRGEADKRLRTLLPALAARLPQDLALNGVDATATTLAAGSAVPAPPPGARALVLQPAEAFSTGYAGGSGLDLEVRLVDHDKGVVWQGTIRFATGGGGSWDAAAVDRAAVPLMEQLRDAKMIDISWRRPVTP